MASASYFSGFNPVKANQEILRVYPDCPYRIANRIEIDRTDNVSRIGIRFLGQVYEITGSPDYVYALASNDNEMQLLHAHNLEKIVRACRVSSTLTPELSDELGVLAIKMTPKYKQKRNSDSSVPIEDAISELMNISFCRLLHREQEKIDVLKKVLLTLQGRVDVASSLAGTRKLCSIENPENMASISSVAHSIFFFLEEWVKYNEDALTLEVRVLGLDILEQLRCLSNKAKNEQRFLSVLFSNIGFCDERKAKIVHDPKFEAIFRQCTEEQFKLMFPNQPEDIFIYDGQIKQMKKASEEGKSQVDDPITEETTQQKKAYRVNHKQGQTPTYSRFASLPASRPITTYPTSRNQGYNYKNQPTQPLKQQNYGLQNRSVIPAQPPRAIQQPRPVAPAVAPARRAPGAYDAYRAIPHTPTRHPFHHTNNIHHGRKR